MSKLNFLVYLNVYSDPSSSNAPSLSNFKWARDITSIPASNPISEATPLAPGEAKMLFSGIRTLAQDGTTQYSISLKPLSSNTYVLTAIAGTLPNFRTPRSIGIDATTQITVTRNGPLAIFTSTGGVALNTTAVVIGDMVRIGSLFNPLSQGEYKILAKTSNSFTVENSSASTEGPITLAAGFASQIQIYSAAGVQVGDTIVISGGFSAVTQGSYKVTGVGANFLEFYSTDALPIESAVMTQAIALYSSAKSLVYIECDQKAIVTINGNQVMNMEPFIINDSTRPGVFMVRSTVYSLAIQNNSLDSANVFLATVE